jgi:DNA ligase-1
MKKFETLYHKGKNGELRQWSVWADGDCVYTEHGLVNGQLQRSCKTCVPKNVGKKNATSAEEQAEAEAQSLHTFKLERKYSLTPEEAELPSLLPMLAHKYDPKKHNLDSGDWYSQRKYDGTRCLARWEGDKVVLYSRSGKIYDVEHISKQLASILGKDDVFDGELYIHGVYLQSIISLIKKPQPGSEKIEYHIYDMPTVEGDDDLPFSDRMHHLTNKLIDIEMKLGNKLVLVPTYIAKDVEEMAQLQSKFIADGYEGLMLRHKDSKYLWGYRSNELLKVKTFQDSEFEIVDVVEGEGKMKGCGIIVCKNDLTDATFKATPKMTMEQRAEIFENKSDYVGKLVTVKYFDRTEDQIPRFPVALSVRDYE